MCVFHALIDVYLIAIYLFIREDFQALSGTAQSFEANGGSTSFKILVSLVMCPLSPPELRIRGAEQ